jgi:hypothetical protein
MSYVPGHLLTEQKGENKYELTCQERRRDSRSRGVG